MNYQTNMYSIFYDRDFHHHLFGGTQGSPIGVLEKLHPSSIGILNINNLI
jgi:hypothetical protein